MQMITAVAEGLTTERYAQHEVFGKPYRLYILSKGVVSRSMNITALLKPGSVWGEDHMILSCTYLFEDVSAVSQGFAEVLVLSRVRFEEILQDYPDNKERLRKYYVKLSVIRGVQYMAREAKKEIKHRKTASSQDSSVQTPEVRPSEALNAKLIEKKHSFQTTAQVGYRLSLSALPGPGSPNFRHSVKRTTIGSPYSGNTKSLDSSLGGSLGTSLDEYGQQIADLSVKMEKLKKHVRAEMDTARNAMDQQIGAIDSLLSSLLVSSTQTGCTSRPPDPKPDPEPVQSPKAKRDPKPGGISCNGGAGEWHTGTTVSSDIPGSEVAV
jgi:hypothetical protein